MPFSFLSKPAIGDPTKKNFADAVIDDLLYLYNQLFSLTGSKELVVNGSFENDVDTDGNPDGWDKTLFTGGTFLLDNTDSSHGLKSAKFTSPGGAGNGGGYLDSTDYIEVSPNRLLHLTWQLKSSAAGVRNKVDLRWFDSAKAFLSTSNIYDSTTNPTSWALIAGASYPPANARYLKIRLTGCDNSNTTAGSTAFDDVKFIQPAFNNMIQFNNSGTWVCPAGVYAVYAELTGGGGGGGGGNSSLGGGGGGAGGYCLGWVSVIPGTSYTVTIGAGGTAGSGGAGGNGGNTTFRTFAANGGTGGSNWAGGGTGGAGGNASGAMINTNGSAGAAAAGNNGGNGGRNATVGYGGGVGGTNALPGTGGAGQGPCSGGGGGGKISPDPDGGAGSAGYVKIRW